MARLNHLANVLVSQLNTLTVMAGSFIVTPAILYGIGDSRYGGWLLINSFLQYLRYLDLGTTAGTMRFGAAALERNDADELKRVMNTSASIFLVMAIATAAGAAGLTVLLPLLYPSIADGQTVTILALGGAMTLDMAFRPFAASLRMRSLFYVYDGIELCTCAIFKIGLVLHYAYSQALSYRVLAFLALGETVTRLGFVILASLIVFPTARRLNPFRPVFSIATKLATMGAAVTVINLADVVRFQLDAGVIGYFMPEDAISISIFGVGARLPSIVYGAILVIGGVLMPKFSGLSATGDHGAILKLLRRASLSTGLVSSLVLVNLAVMGPQFLMLWLKKPWVATSSHILLILLPAYFIALLAGPSTALLVGRGNLRGLTLLTVAEAATNFVLSVLLVRPFGVYGVALGTAIPLALFRGVLFPLLLEKEIQLSPWQYMSMQARGVGIGALYFALVGALAFVSLPSYTRFVLLGAGTVLVFSVLVLTLVPEARVAFVERLPSRRARRSVE